MEIDIYVRLESKNLCEYSKKSIDSIIESTSLENYKPSSIAKAIKEFIV